MILNFREEAYVTAIHKKMSGEIIGGTFGRIPLPILYGFGITPVSLYGIHKDLIEESPSTGYCDALRSTEGYALTDRCPFIHSSSFFISDDLCPKRVELLNSLPLKKQVYIYSIKDKNMEEAVEEQEKLIRFLEEFTKKTIDYSLVEKSFELLLEIDSLLLELKNSSLTGKEYSKVCYETQYIFDLEVRKNFIESLPVQGNNTDKTSVYSAPLGGIIEDFPLEEDEFLDDSLSCTPCTPTVFEREAALTEDIARYYRPVDHFIVHGFRDCPYADQNTITY